MKLFVTVTALIACLLGPSDSHARRGNCAELSEKIDNSKVYAEVISRGHMDLELVVVKKAFYYPKLKITGGGKGYNAQNLPQCEMEETSSLELLNRNITTHTTFDYDYHTSAYAICVFNRQNKVVESHIICNYEFGD